MSDQLPTRHPSSAIARFVSWWLEGLAAAMGDGPSRHAAWTRILVKTGEGATIHTRRRDRTELIKTIGQDQLESSNNTWRLPPAARTRRGDVSVLRLGLDQVLRHDLQIPRGAQDVIDPVIRNQLERLVPWPPEDLIYGYEISDSESDDDRLAVACVATSKKRVSDAQAVAGRFDFVPDFIDVAECTDEKLGIVLHGASMAEKQTVTRPIARTLATIAILAGLVAASGLWRMTTQNAEFANLQNAMANVDAHVAEAHRLEEANAAVMAERARLIARRSANRPMVATLEALSRTLPDHAYLERLEVRERDVEIRGTARDAASLMKGLEASPVFSKARFSAPTTRTGGSGEKFAITLHLETAATSGDEK